jgi:cbb3-type cytochrome oxidase subunit 3
MHRTKDLNNGKDIMEVNVYDKKTYHYLFNLNENVLAFSMLNDHQDNLWMSTMHTGLYLYKRTSSIVPCLQSPYDEVNFYSVSCLDDGTLLAGNEKGEIVERKNNKQKVHKVYSSNKIEWQRYVIPSQHNIFTFSDGGVFMNYSKEILPLEKAEHLKVKAAMPLNDSIILIGTNNGLYELNTHRITISHQPIQQKLVNSLAHINQERIYIGSTDGLHYFNLKDSSYHHLNDNALLNDRIVAMCTTNNQLLWVATATNGIVVLKNNQVVKHISEANGLASNNSMAIVPGKEGQVWLGSNEGVSRIFYNLYKDSIQERVQNLSVIDGMSHPIVNQLFYAREKVFVATQKGVCMIPDSVPVPLIKVELTNIKINQKDTSLLSYYKLKANEKDIAMQFSGANLLGYFKHLDYSRDEGKTWLGLDENKLRIDFDNGLHTIWVRAVDVNKNSSPAILKLSFDIAIPFWKRWWFWVIVMLLIQLAIAYALYKRQQRKEIEKRKVELAKANLASLEQQAFTSLMNPHFMFNALNSIQHYINHQDRQNANRYLSDFASLIRKNFEAAQQAFIPLEQEIENISLYLRLEKMRFNDKFNFELVYDKHIDPDEWMMPTMILQPLVENAILHGLMPSKIPGKLTMQLSIQQDDLLLEVIDNGIGVENSRALKQGSKHRSRGMELIYKRLQALSFFSQHELQLVYSVPFNDERNPGNKTSLVIPYDLYQAWKKVSKEQQVL